MLHVERAPVRGVPFETGREAPQGSGLASLAVIASMLRRRIVFIGCCVIAVLALAVAFVQSSKPLYTASTNIVIDPRKAFELANGASPTLIQIGMDSSSIDSQVELLKSSRLAASVLRSLNMQDDPEFKTASNPVEAALRWIRHAIAPTDVTGRVAPDEVDPDVLQTFADRLDVERVKETYVITASFRSRDPERAALIANAIGKGYIDAQLAAKRAVAEQAGAWLTTQLEQQRGEALQADKKLQAFRAANDIVGAEADASINGQMAREITNQLVSSEAASAQLQSKYDAILAAVKSPKPDAAVADFLDDPEVLAIRTKYSQTVLQAAQAESIYGAGNVKIAEAMKKSLREQLGDALGRLKITYEKRLAVARANEASLRAKRTEFIDKMKQREAAQVELNILQRNSDTASTLYQSILERFRSVVQQQSFPVSEARVLDEATIPHAKSSPRMAVSLALGMFAGLAFGVGGALLLEMRNRGFRVASDVEDNLQAPFLGFLPEVSVRLPRERWREGDDRVMSPELGIYRLSVERPFSLFSETLRSIRVAVDAAAAETPQGVKILGVVSSVPGEGKSTSSANFAQLLAHGGRRVLLVDAEMRAAGLTESLVDGPAPGLIQILRDGLDWRDVALVDPVTGLNFVPAGGGQREFAQTSDALASEAMRTFLQRAAVEHDYIVLDLPPMAPLVDVRAVSGMVDAFVLLVAWGQTSRTTVAEALNSNAAVRDKLLGAVLTRVDLKQLRRYMPNQDSFMSKRNVASYFG